MAKSVGKQVGSPAETPAASTLSSDVTEAKVSDWALSTTTNVAPSGRIRGVLVGVNLVIVLLSLTVLWSAMYSSLTRPSQPTTFLGSLVSNSFLFTLVMYFDVFLLILSSVFIAVSLCGMVGALRENLAMLDYYRYLLGAIVLVNIATAIAGALLPRPARNSLKESSYKQFIEAYRHSDDFQQVVDSLQKSMHCCGFSQDSFRDWNLNEYFRCDVDNPSNQRCAVPSSCCRDRRPNASEVAEEVTVPRFCGHGVLLMSDEKAWEHVNTRSCADALLSVVTNNVVPLVGFGMLLNMFLLFMIVTTVVLQDQVKEVRAIYDAYYKALSQGQAGMEESGIRLPEKAAAAAPPDAKGACLFNWGETDKPEAGPSKGAVDAAKTRSKRSKPILPSP
ncbi:hypothetical protein HPB48_010002 [Haemaphysalis longicornis]|uniref:Tetraspanin n=1 Tax=Haemaphysalis longicornis TaxID=44386 RepID=A0A9J6G7X9_HAELO|nr:hypothetical protein HPB48_010002 [Haemaphysalis longicornis]